jgi:glycine betaine/proline transport system permease protein
VLAVALDRLSQAVATRSPVMYHERPRNWIRRHPYISFSVFWIVFTGVAGAFFDPVQTYPKSLEITTGAFWGDLVKYINVTFYDYLEGLKTFFLLHLLIPFKRFLLHLPWLAVVTLVGLAGWRLGGLKLAIVTVSLALFIVVTGQWEKAMITLYLCGISVIIASLIGVPIGIAAAQNARFGRAANFVVDTLQTLPSFVYLMPVVMLFRVGDFSAMIAVVAYALAPAIRYTAHGIGQIDPNLVEAGVAAGCTRWQILRKIKLPLAVPEIMLGINQTIMLALSMLVITALVGTRDLGQEVYIALTKADTGRGIVAGLSVAFIAITADRLIAAGSGHLRRQLGLGETRGLKI